MTSAHDFAGTRHHPSLTQSFPSKRPSAIKAEISVLLHICNLACAGVARPKETNMSAMVTARDLIGTGAAALESRMVELTSIPAHCVNRRASRGWRENR